MLTAERVLGFLSLEKESLCFAETSITIHQSTRRIILNDLNRYHHRLRVVESPTVASCLKKECWKYWYVRGLHWQDKGKFNNKELYNLYYSTIIIITCKLRSQDSIGTIVSMSQTGQHRNFSSFPNTASGWILQSDKTSTGTHPASYLRSTGTSFPGVKAAGSSSWQLISFQYQV
jgi:hypothetical protein